MITYRVIRCYNVRACDEFIIEAESKEQAIDKANFTEGRYVDTQYLDAEDLEESFEVEIVGTDLES